MPRQFFTLKSILTAQPGTQSGGWSNGAAGNGGSAMLEGAAGGDQPVAVHDLNIFEVDSLPPGKNPLERNITPPAAHTPEDDEVVGAPHTADEEVYMEEGYDENQEVDYADEAAEPPSLTPIAAPAAQAAPPAPVAVLPPPPPPAPPPPPPPPPPPIARFANLVTYDGAFEPVKNQMAQILGQSLNEVMRLRARAAEAFENKAEEMLSDLAATVLGRELRTDPADLANIVAQMRARMVGDSAVQIRVSPEDAGYIKGPVTADPSLGFGDLVFETEEGEIDLRLGTRLSALLRGQNVQL